MDGHGPNASGNVPGIVNKHGSNATSAHGMYLPTVDDATSSSSLSFFVDHFFVFVFFLFFFFAIFLFESMVLR